MNLSFNENMTGYIYPGESDPKNGETKGKEKNFLCAMHGVISIEDVKKFITITERTARIEGTVNVAGLGLNLQIESGIFNCYRIDNNKDKNRIEKVMEYQIHFKSELDESYFMHGKKHLFDDPHQFDMLSDSTTLFTKIYKGDTDDERNLYAAGIIKVSFAATVEMLVSTRVTGTTKPIEKVETVSQFYDFFFGESYGIYFKKLGFFYSTGYQNFVLSGECSVDGQKKNFFFYSGAHDIGFPWGDNNTFWDVSLVLAGKDKDGNIAYEKYLIADKDLYNNLKIDLNDNNPSKYTYNGKIYRLKKGYAVSFSDDLLKADKSKILESVDAQIDLVFIPTVPKDGSKDVPAVIIPFGLIEGLENPVLEYANSLIKKFLPEHKGMGVRLGIRSVELKEAEIKIGNKQIVIDNEKTFGEVENSTIKYVKDPVLNYNYFCGINPQDKTILLHTTGGVLFNHTVYYAKNIIDYAFSKLAAPFKSTEIRINNSSLKAIDHKPKTLKVKNDYILEVNFDHYEIGVFQRRIVLINDHRGNDILALEEDVKRINLSRIPAANTVKTNSPLDMTESTVAVYKSTLPVWQEEKYHDPYEDREGVMDNFLAFFNLNKHHIKDQVPVKEREEKENDDKRQLLHKVVQSTNFIDALYQRAEKVNKKPSEMKIVIKPNLMFLYDKFDQTTYTSPVLIKELVDIIYDEGFTNITVVEAQSTYGNYFENRDVVNVAKYVGLESCERFKVVDLSDQSTWQNPEKEFTGPLKPVMIDGNMSSTKVPKIWKDADFRISFAKNKTHSYAYYTLCIKCIYGALPVQNKYKEYHCNRGIFGSTIEYILHYPIHFGFIDAYTSSDGPFGVFANKTPNYTRTLIGGENIIAVDWIGAAKMGLDPLLSQFMKLAVEQFGKPRINLIGDMKDEIYDPWINVPVESVYSMNNMLDKNYQFGNAFTNAMMNTDKKAFPVKKEGWFMKMFRFIEAPMRAMVFGNHEILKKAYDAGPFEEPKKEAFDDVKYDKE